MPIVAEQPDDDIETLGDAYPKEQARCRELLVAYHQFDGDPGVNCSFAIASIEDVLRRADRAAVEGDLVAMHLVFEEMQECQ